MLPVKLAGLGWYLPPRRVTNAELEERLDIPADWIERVTGVYERRYVTSETVVAMGVAASCMALEAAGVDVLDLYANICAFASPPESIPLTAAFLQPGLQYTGGGGGRFCFQATCLRI